MGRHWNWTHRVAVTAGLPAVIAITVIAGPPPACSAWEWVGECRISVRNNCVSTRKEENIV